MKRKNNLVASGNAIDFRHLANLIRYSHLYCGYGHQINDLTTALSFETITEICAKHFEVDENILLDKKGTKYSTHRGVFMGVIYFYSNVDYCLIGKKFHRHSYTITEAAKSVCSYLDPCLEYNRKNIKEAVERILLECEVLSGGRFLRNVCPKLDVIDKWSINCLAISDIKTESSFSVDEILDIPKKDLEWFKKNTRMLTALSIDGKYQSSVTARLWSQCDYLYLMQSFGYRFISWQEHVAMNLREASKIQQRTAERLKDMLARHAGTVTKNKCSGCIWGEQGLCPATVQSSGFCPKTENNTPSLDEDGDRLKIIYTNDINKMYLFNYMEQ